jgi:hypothetical protein
VKINIKNLAIYPSATWDVIGFSIIEYSPIKGYNLLKLFQSCRGYIGQNLYDIKNKKTTTPRGYHFTNNKFSYKTGLTYVAIRFNPSNTTEKNTFLSEKSLKWLNKFEEQAGVKLSTIATTQDPNVFIIIGSTYWKNSCWKLMLYTFLIKCMYYKNHKQCNPEYWQQLDKRHPTITNTNNLDIFLSKVATSWKDEIFSKEIYGKDLISMTHYHNGFNAICYGNNPPMAKLLGIPEGITPCVV